MWHCKTRALAEEMATEARRYTWAYGRRKYNGRVTIRRVRAAKDEIGRAEG